MKVILCRIDYSPQGTFGELKINGQLICVTCEDPWKKNAEGESCIPLGTYKCIPHNTRKYPNVWEIAEVPNRTAILIHNGNTENDTRGCILVGKTFGHVNGKPAVLNSVETLNKLRKTLPGTFELEITSI